MAGKRSPPNPSISQLTSPRNQIALRRWRFRCVNSNHIPVGTPLSERRRQPISSEQMSLIDAAERHWGRIGRNVVVKALFNGVPTDEIRAEMLHCIKAK